MKYFTFKYLKNIAIKTLKYFKILFMKMFHDIFSFHYI